ncbi:hypothetical protein LCGC14_0396810 [marine sediment metagenome]|uniref:Uncharacterized protein n=1 Tax=marine sediment metagenome TaxID=412755 RepID=A0A0F9T3Y9_9ZZZZ
MQIWLPISYGGRTRNILIPYSHSIDESQLNDIVQWQTEKTLDELKKLPPKPVRTISKEDVGEILKDYMKFLRRENG